jgi:iron complex outermembrane recepter protein
MPMPTFIRSLSACLSLTFGFLAGTAVAEISDQPLEINIPAGSLAEALEKLGEQSGLQIMYEPAVAEGIRVTAVNGTLTASDALGKLIAHTGLKADRVNEKTVVLKLAQAETASGSNKQQEPQQPASADESQPQESGELAEIVVSAQKRLESIQEVPVPVTALSGDALVNGNQLRLQDYYTSVPGMNLSSNGRGDANLAIRGLTTGADSGNPTVGTTVDDVPYGASSTYGAGGSNPPPDFDPSDLARVEVLRGPQGTLYGASSIGGLLKFVTVDPSTERASGRLQLGTSSVRNGDDFGYNVRGAFNLPVSDTWAIRGSAFSRRDPGYIDNPALGIEGVNQVDVRGGRFSVLWQASPSASLKLNALLQDSQADGSPDIDRNPGLGDLEQEALRNTGGYHRRIELYSATLKAQLGSVDLTAIGGYGINSLLSNSMDFTPAFGPLTEELFGVAGTELVNEGRNSKFTQEIRLSSELGEKISWLAGAFYTDEKNRFHQQILARDPDTAAVVGSWLNANWPTTYEEYAVFADVTFQVTDRLDIQLGGRESENRQTYSEVDEGPYTELLGHPSPIVNPQVKTKDSSFTYLLTPRLRISPDLMVYTRLASGYRTGGPNSTCTVLGVPCHFEPDKTANYEIGVKGNIFGRLLSFDASVYYIDWKDIQLGVSDPVSFAVYYSNGSRAKSQGLELSMESQPRDGLTLGGWIAWGEAELTEDFPLDSSLFGNSGDRLPNSSRLSGRLSLEQEWPITGNVSAIVGGAVSYVGSREGNFAAVSSGSTRRERYPSYAQMDLRAGVEYESWAVNVFITNVTDKRGVIDGGAGSFNFDPFAFHYIQPRTIGAQLSRTF